MKVEVLDKDGLATKLRRASAIRWEAIVKKNLAEMFNRGTDLTPVDTGELRLSRSTSLTDGGMDGEFGYTKEYAPHVEYGHRTIGGGYVKGQQFLKKNADRQRPIFNRDMEAAIRKVFGNA